MNRNTVIDIKHQLYHVICFIIQINHSDCSFSSFRIGLFLIDKLLIGFIIIDNVQVFVS